MPNPEPQEYKSVNPYTGLLEDPEEVKRLAVSLLSFSRALVSAPLMRMLLPRSFFFDAGAFLAGAETLLVPTTQAQYMRQLAILVYGSLDAETERQIRAWGYSETLPVTHPDAPHPVESMQGFDRELQDSRILQTAIEQIAQEDADRAAQEHPIEEGLSETQLAEQVQSFLDNLIAQLENDTKQED